MELKLPLKDIQVTQPFGVNYVDFYKSMGIIGHNGIDLKAKIGCPCYAAVSGVVEFAGTDGDGGKCVTIVTQKTGKGYKIIYYHLNKIMVKAGKLIKCGEQVGETGNTGKYTSGPHLHFGVKELYNNNVVNTDNGYKGAIDPAQFFPKNWDKSSAYHRYGRKQEWLAEFNMRFKNVWLHRQLNKTGDIYKINDTEFINALVYGGWGFEDVQNPAMYEIWGWATKDQYLKGKINFS